MKPCIFSREFGWSLAVGTLGYGGPNPDQNREEQADLLYRDRRRSLVSLLRFTTTDARERAAKMVRN